MGGVLNIKSASIVLVFVLGIGLAFYGGRVYQNNVDQPLFSQYTPASTGGARGAGGAAGATGGPGASFFGGSASGTSQSAAALAYATPPGGGSSSGSADTSGTGGPGGTQGSGGNGAGGAPGASSGTQSGGAASGTGGAQGGGAAGGTGGQQSVPLGGNGAAAGSATATTGTASASTDVAGTLVGVSGGTISLKTSDGKTTSIATSPASKFYLAKAASASALKAGQKVTAAVDPAQSSGGAPQGFAAGSITIAPSGSSLYAYVKDAQQQGASGGFGFSPAGTVASVSGSTLNLEMSASRSFALTLSSSTVVYQLSSVDAAAIPVGAAVTVHESTVGGKVVADNIVGSSISGKVASLTSAPALRAGGPGGAGGQGGGFGGGSGQGGNGSGQTQ